MQKKIILALLMAALLTGGAFAQIDMSAGLGGNFSMYMTSVSHPDYDINNPKPIIGGGFYAFFDATYAMAKVGMFIGGNSQETDLGIFEKWKTKNSATYFSLGLLGKYPIDLGIFTLFPMLGFEYNIFMSSKKSVEINGVTVEDESGKFKRSDAPDGHSSDFDMLILQAGVGADFNLTDNIYLRPSVLWGIDFHRADGEKPEGGSLFKHKLDVGIAVGYKF